MCRARCILAAIALLCLPGTSCDDRGRGLPSQSDDPGGGGDPNGPQVGGQSVVYTLATLPTEQGLYLFALDVKTDELLDSVSLSDPGDRVQVSPDGETVYVHSLNPFRTVAFSAIGLERIGEMPIVGPYYFDSAGAYGVVDYGDRVLKFSLPDMQRTDSLMMSSYVFRGNLDTSTDQFYAWGMTGSKVFVVDVNAMTLTDSLVIRTGSGATVYVTQLLPVGEFNRLLVIGGPVDGETAFVVDGTTGTAINAIDHVWQSGEFCRVPHGNWVFASDHGSPWRGEVGPHKIVGYNVATDEALDPISTIVTIGQETKRYDIGELAATPDGRYLYGADISAYGVLKVDLENRVVSDPFRQLNPIAAASVNIGTR